MLVGSLGDVIFEVSSYKVLTFKEFKREGGAKYATHEVIGQPPKVEFLHRELEKLSLEIDLVKNLGVKPEDEVQKISDMCNDGEANYLIFGGKVYGDCQWVIESYSENVRYFGANGETILSKVNLKLTEYN